MSHDTHIASHTQTIGLRVVDMTLSHMRHTHTNTVAARHINESRHVYEQVMSLKYERVISLKYERVMSHM